MPTTQAAWTRLSRRAPLGLALAAIVCLRASGDSRSGVAYAAETCSASPGAGDYCASYQCGPCGEGEGDCDPGQCGSGLECVEEGSVDRCRPTGDTCDTSPGAGDYCASYQCGPCGEGEGDCDPGQCDAGLTCVEEGAVDRCRPDDDDCDASEGAGDYCASYRCGPCGEGEGDCDPGQCGSGLECVEEGAVDRCRAASSGSGSSNFQVNLNGVWRGICCVGGVPELSDKDCWWTEYDRRLTDESVNLELDCPEGGPTTCRCDGSGERMHGYGGAHLDASIGLPNGGPVYPNYGQETCVVIQSDGDLGTAWTSSACPKFRLD